MPQIKDKQRVANRIAEGIEAIAKSEGNKDRSDAYVPVALELSHPKERQISYDTIRSWTYPGSIPNSIEDGRFYGLIYLVLRTEKVDLRWLVSLLEGTSVPFVRPLFPDLLRAYLSQARLQGNLLAEAKISEIVQLFFHDSRSDMRGLEYIYRTGGFNRELLQPLIPLEPVIREFISEAREIGIQGLSLYRYIENFSHQLVSALNAGTTIRVICVHPASDAIGMMAFRSASETPVSIQRKRITDTLESLDRIQARTQTNRLHVRLIDYMPPYGITVYHHKGDVMRSVCQARLNTFRSPSSDTPTIFTTSTSNRDWFDFFARQFDLLWNAATPINGE